MEPDAAEEQDWNGPGHPPGEGPRVAASPGRDEYEKIVEQVESAAPEMVASVMAMDDATVMDVLEEHMKQGARYLARRDRPRALRALAEVALELMQDQGAAKLPHKSDVP